MPGASTLTDASLEWGRGGDHDGAEFDWLAEDTFVRGLRAYLAAVANALGIGLESTTVDTAGPVSAYLALDGRVPNFPDRDLALLWDERHGWSIAVETHSGEDLLILTYLDPRHGPVPAPRTVVDFVSAVRAGRPVGRADPPDRFRHTRRHIDTLLAPYRHQALRQALAVS